MPSNITFTPVSVSGGRWSSNAQDPNNAPTVANAIPNQSATEDSAFSFQFASNTFFDADGDTLTYTATLSSGAALPAWLTFTSGTRTFSGTPLTANIGVITVRVTADDGQDTVYDDFTLTVVSASLVTRTINGSGFGTKSTTAYYDDFETRSTGQVGTLVGSLDISNTTGVQIITTNTYSGVKSLSATNYNTNTFPKPNLPLSGNNTRVYASCRLYVAGDVTATAVWKMWRIGSPPETVYGGVPHAGESWTTGGDGMPFGFGGEIVNSNGKTSWHAHNPAGSNFGIYDKDRWMFLECEFYTGTVDVSNCYMKCWVDGVQVLSWVNRPYLTSANSQLPDWILIPCQGMDNNPSCSVVWDHLYIDESNARVIMTDNATYASSTFGSKCNVLPIISYSDTEIVCQDVTTGFTGGETAHLHLWKDDGTYSYLGTVTV